MTYYDTPAVCSRMVTTVEEENGGEAFVKIWRKCNGRKNCQELMERRINHQNLKNVISRLIFLSLLSFQIGVVSGK